jgi:hypothetical protein
MERRAFNVAEPEKSGLAVVFYPVGIRLIGVSATPFAVSINPVCYVAFYREPTAKQRDTGKFRYSYADLWNRPAVA